MTLVAQPDSQPRAGAHTCEEDKHKGWKLMTTYALRITCKLAGGEIETKEHSIFLTLPPLARPVEVFLSERRETDDCRLTLWCGGFHSEVEARTAGERVKTALILAGLLIGVGIDAGTDQVVSPAAQRKDGQPDDRLQPDVHGLQVIPEIDGMLFGFLRVGPPVKRILPGDFEKRVTESDALGKQLTRKQTLAAQLYNQSHFQSSDVARFLTLISAVEALADRSSRSGAARVLIERMIAMTAAAADLDESEREALRNGLRSLKQESIGSAIGTLVRAYCEESAAKDVSRAYAIRSNLLHTGESPSGTDLPAELRKLDVIVRNLVVRHVANMR